MPNGCWNWQKCLRQGYGAITSKGKTHGVHRLTYSLWHGVTLRSEDFICHTCDNRKCCNPDHLYKGNAKTNNCDTVERGRHYETKKTQCKRGHKFSEENVLIILHKDKKHRTCRKCKIDHSQRIWAKNKQKYNEKRRLKYNLTKET